MNYHPSPRWYLRLDTFRSTVTLLQEAVDLKRQRGLSDLELEGMVQRFVVSWEQGWKLLREFLIEELVNLDALTAAAVIRAAFATGLIEDGDLWMAAGKARNTLSHTYDSAARDAAIVAIEQDYLPMFRLTLNDFQKRRSDG